MPKRRKLLRIAVVMVVGMVLGLAALLFDNSESPRISVSEREIDFGRVSPGGVAKEIIYIRNTGRRPLRIENVKLSCVCSHATLNKQLIPPGDAADLELSVRGSSGRHETRGQVWVVSNDPISPVTELLLRFSDLADVWAEPSSLDFGRVSREALPESRPIRIHFGRDYKIDPASLRCESTSPYFKAALMGSDDPGVAAVRVELIAAAPSGEHRAAVVLQTRGGGASASVALHAFVRGEVYAVPPDVVLGPLVKESAGRNLQSISIRRRDGKQGKVKVSLSRELDSVIEVRAHGPDELEVWFRRVEGIQSELTGAILARVETDGANDEILSIPVTLIWASERVSRQTGAGE